MEYKKISVFLAVILAGSVILNVIFWYNSDTQNTDCFVTAGFEPPEPVEKELARQYLENYQSTMREGDNLGGIITRSAFDELMCVEKCNAISYTFGRMPDKEGKLSGLFVIYNGVYVEEDAAGIKVNDLNMPFFMSRHWCPPTCFAW